MTMTTMFAVPFTILLASGAPVAAGEGLQVTIYNQNFALVKESRALDLRAGTNDARFTDVTALLEPDSVVLRDPKDPDGLRILEQNYEGDPLSEGYLLRQYEGRTLAFQTLNPATGKMEVRTGRVIRSGYLPQHAGWRVASVYGGPVFTSAGGATSAIVEVDGKIQFSLPGQPLFDALASDAILKPTLLWKLWADKGGARDVELSYLTGGMRWEATYNLVAPEKGDRFDLVGWVTLENQSGADMKEARLKLMAGDVSRVQPPAVPMMRNEMMLAAQSEAAPQVTEKAFDEYHLYTLQQPATLRDHEIKQVEFCRGDQIPGARLYVYDGAENSAKIATVLEFTNDKASGLGLPLPKGSMKLYRTDSDGRREFIGENAIDHTPADEKVRIRLGNAFDLVGERRQTAYHVDERGRSADESFEIKVRNHKKEGVEVRVVEHLYRWLNWKVAESSDPFVKTDSRTGEFRVKVPPDGEKVVTYRVHYSW